MSLEGCKVDDPVVAASSATDGLVAIVARSAEAIFRRELATDLGSSWHEDNVESGVLLRWMRVRSSFVP